MLRSNQNKYKNNNKIVQNSKSEKTEKSMTSQLVSTIEIKKQPIILRSVSVYIYFDQSKSKEEGGEVQREQRAERNSFNIFSKKEIIKSRSQDFK